MTDNQINAARHILRTVIRTSSISGAATLVAYASLNDLINEIERLKTAAAPQTQP